jgi:hypothetical protein
MVVVDISNTVLVSTGVVVCVGRVDVLFEIVVRFHGKIVLLLVKIINEKRKSKRNILFDELHRILLA